MYPDNGGHAKVEMEMEMNLLDSLQNYVTQIVNHPLKIDKQEFIKEGKNVQKEVKERYERFQKTKWQTQYEALQ